MSSPLAGLRVVELAIDIAGPYAAKLLADAGADVVKVEHPDGGDPMRHWTASGVELGRGDDSVLFHFLNTSKRSVAIDWRRASGRAELLRLVGGADVVIESVGPEAGVDWPAVAACAPTTSLVSVSWFGRSGPWKDRAATEFTLQAWAGSTAIRGTADRPPLAAGGRLGEWLAGGYAATGALAAVMGARRMGRGQHVDLSLLEVVHLSMAPFATVVDSFSGGTFLPSRTVEIPSIEPAADGYVGFCTITNQQWRDFLVLIERGELVDDPELAHHLTRDQRRQQVYAIIHAWTKQHTVADIIERATLLRIPVVPIGNGATVSELAHFQARGVYARLPGTNVVAPRPPYRLGRSRLRSPTPAPRLGAHHGSAWEEPRPRPSPPLDHNPLPLAGLRVIDLTMFWAGPLVGHFLALLGADVIKVESIQRPDGIRFASTQQPTAEHCWEWSAMFHGINAGKRGITLDLSRPRGLALAKALIAKADALVENFSPRVLDNLGLHYDELAREHPELIVLRMPAFGLDGPWRDRTGFAQTMEQISGLAWVTGFADGPPVIPRGPCDPLAGLHAVLAFLVALEHRRRSGQGQLVESVMVEAALNAAAEQVLEWQAYGALLGRAGNRGPVAAPQNLYACQGEEQWLALAVVTDVQWLALVELLARPAWAIDPALATATGRRARHAQIDTELSRWCATQERDTLVEALLGSGIPAAPLTHPRDVTHNPQIRARGFLQSLAHPVTGTHELPGLPMRFSMLGARWYRTPAPTLGEHTEEVLRDLLGLDTVEIGRLRADGIIGNRPVGL